MIRLTLLLLMYAGSCLQMVGQVSTGSPRAAGPNDYRVGAGDVITVSVGGLPELSRTVTVSNSGKIHLPYTGIVQVAPLTCSQIEEEIQRRLKQQQLVKDPWVQVGIADYRAHSVYVVGEVMQPGQYVIRSEMYVLDLLSLSLGVGEWVSPVVYLFRRAEPSMQDGRQGEAQPADSLADAIPINLQELYSGKRPELNLKLRGGDMLYCPERQREYFYVFGDVARPGVLEFKTQEEVLVSRAVSMAGGTLPTARASKGVLIRYDKTGKREDMAVDFQAVLRGKKPDIPIRPNDVIFIPGSAMKGLGWGLLNTIPGVAEAAAVF